MVDASKIIQEEDRECFLSHQTVSRSAKDTYCISKFSKRRSVFELPHRKHKYDSILSILACINLSLFRANFTNIFETVHFSKELPLWACRSLVNLQVFVGLALLGFLFNTTFF